MPGIPNTKKGISLVGISSQSSIKQYPTGSSVIGPGTDGYVLQSDSTSPTGFSWVSSSGGGGGGSPTGNAGGDLTGSYPNPTIKDAAITPIKADLNQVWNFTNELQVDSMDVIVEGDSRLTNSRTPTGNAGGDLTGSYPNPTISSSAVTPTKADLTQTWNFTGPLQSGSQAVVVTTDTRLTNSRNPTGSAGGDLTGTYPNPTLAAITSAGTSGSANTIPVVTIDTKGRVTTLSSSAVSITTASVSGLGTAAGLTSDTDGTLAANSDTRIATQKATKTYADTKVAKAGDTMTGTLKAIFSTSSGDPSKTPGLYAVNNNPYGGQPNYSFSIVSLVSTTSASSNVIADLFSDGGFYVPGGGLFFRSSNGHPFIFAYGPQFPAYNYLYMSTGSMSFLTNRASAPECLFDFGRHSGAGTFSGNTSAQFLEHTNTTSQTPFSMLRLVRGGAFGVGYANTAEFRMSSWQAPGGSFFPYSRLTIALKSVNSWAEAADKEVAEFRDSGMLKLTSSTPSLGIGVNATAKLHIMAGSSTANNAPLKFTSGSLLATPESGSVEFNGDKLYLTITSSSARKEIVLSDNGLTSGSIPVATTNGRLTNSNIYSVYNSGTTAGTAGTSVSLKVLTFTTSNEFRFLRLAVRGVYPTGGEAFARTINAAWGSGSMGMFQTGADELGTLMFSGTKLDGATIQTSGSGADIYVKCTDVEGAGGTVTWVVAGEYF